MATNNSINNIYSAGRLIKIRTLSGSGTYTATAGTNSIWVQCVGGGGGGGAATALASQTSCGAGGGGGGYVTKYYAVVPTGTAYAVGGGGAGGTTSNGSSGGDTTFNAGDMHVDGAGGGAAMTTSTATQAISIGGSAGFADIGDNSDLKVQGTKGYPGIVLLGASSIGVSGQGGQPGCGFGPAPYVTTNTASASPASPGVGGVGAFMNGAGTRAAGAGGAGTIIVWEFS